MLAMRHLDPAAFTPALAYGQFRKLNAFWSYCMPRINCLDEHKRASLSYKSICFLSCAEIIPECHLTAPEGPSEERQLETCCGNWWHWIAPRPLLKRFFGTNRDCLVDWKSSSLAVTSSTGSGCLCSPCPIPHRRSEHRAAAKTSPKFIAPSSKAVHQPALNLSLYILLCIAFLIYKEIKKVFWGVFFPN